MLLPADRNFDLGQVLAQRVGAGRNPIFRRISGWDPSEGYLKPEKYPSLVSASALTGTMPAQVPLVFRDNTGPLFLGRDASSRLRQLDITNGDWEPAGDWQNCSVNPNTDIVTSTGHGYADNDPIQFQTTANGLTAGTTYYVLLIGDDNFQVRATAGGAAMNLTGVITANVVAALAGPVLSMEVDSGPFQLGPLAVFPTKTGLRAYEARSTAKKNRLFCLKSPEDYSEGATLTVTPSATQATQLFDLVAQAGEGSTATDNVLHFMGVSGSYVGVTYTDYENLRFFNTSAPGTLAFTMNIADVVLTNQRYLVMDFVLKYVGSSDPTQLIKGEFLNNDIAASGWELVLFSDDACTVEIRRMAIPQLSVDGRVNRVVFALGTLVDGETCKGMGIRTASYYVAPTGGLDSYNLWVYSNAFSEDYNYEGNVLQPTVKFSHSGWGPRLPVDPGLGVNNSSAVVIEQFPETAEAPASPDRPRVKWQYCFRGRSALSIDDYDQLLSDPSAETAEYLADPWRVYALSITLPTDGDGNDVLDDYGAYATHALLYRSSYTGLGEDQIVTDLGVWTNPTYAGKMDIDGGLDYDDVGRTGQACTVTLADNLVTSVVHRLYVGDIITFSASGGGITRGNLYYVITTPSDDTFTISATPGGTELDITADGSNTWSSYGKVLTTDDDYTLPQYLEAVHTIADDCRYAIVTDNRIYAGHLTHDGSSWLRPLYVQVSNAGDYTSFPTTPRTGAYLTSDGQEIGRFAPDSSVIRGMLASRQSKLTWTDRGLWEILGQDAAAPWQIIRGDKVGAGSAKTLVDFPSQRIWHGPNNSYFYRHAGGLAEPISKGIFDSSLFDWTLAHGAVPSKQRYVFFGYYNDTAEATPWCLMIYDLLSGAWRSTHSVCYQFAGIAVDEATEEVYALTASGNVVNVFGAWQAYGDTNLVRKAEWQFLVIAPPNAYRKVANVVADIITAQASISMTLGYASQGPGDVAVATAAKTITSAKTQYRWPIPSQGDGISIYLTYTGASPPEIHDLRVEVDDDILA